MEAPIESLINELLNDPNALQVENLKLNGVNITLVSCPYELESTVYNNPIWGRLARAAGKAKGINHFFDKIGDLAIKHEKEVAVADIANGPKYSIYHAGLRAVPGPLLMSVAPDKFGSFLGVCSLVYGNGMSMQELFRIGAFDLERKNFERFIIDMEDARRLLTAKGIRQEVEKRVEGSQLTYIAPRAHVSRVKWYLEHPNDIVSNTKAKAYSLAAGLPRSTRIYKNSKMFHSWQLVSDIPTKV